MRPEARTILAAAPAPAAAAALTPARLRSLLRKAGRSRGIDTEAARLHEAFRAPQMRQLPLVEAAMGRQALALLRQLDAACTAAEDLEQAVTESFNQHPDAGIITSFPGLGALTGARVLAETGDDRSRFSDAKGLKAYAGAAPVTRASGKTKSVTHRRVKNNRLAAAGYIWAFAALTASPGARAHYDRRKTAGDRHALPSATCSDASSAACTTAWPPASTTTRPPPSPPPQTKPPRQLDNLTASDVSSPPAAASKPKTSYACDRASSRQPIREEVTGSGPPAAPASRPRSSSPCPAASRCRAAAFSSSSPASS
jgi:hypothetical protein